jgi:hypothetical protein
MFANIHKLLVAAAFSLCCGAAAAQSKEIAPEADSDLNEPTLYDFLLGEIALQRGDLPLAAKTYLDLAKRTRDPRIARRAVEVASQARLPEVALEAARLWNSIEPGSAHSLQVLAAMLVAAKRVDEAGPVLEKLLAAEGVSRENGFMQLNRLLSGNPDKPSNLRVIRALAAKHPDLPQAHFAVAQAAALAEDDAAAIASARRALELRPDWELAATFEAQLLQKRSPAEPAKDFRIADAKSFRVYQHATELQDLELGKGNGDGVANPGETIAILLPDGEGYRAARLDGVRHVDGHVEPVHRAVGRVVVDGEIGRPGDAHALLQQARTIPKDEHNDPEKREDNKRDKCGAITCASQHKLKEILDALPIAFDFVTLIGESLHIRDSLKGFLHNGPAVGEAILCFAREATDLSAEQNGDNH